MSTVQFLTMQKLVSELYPGPAWKYRVYHQMSTEQITAIYFKALNRGDFSKEKKKERNQIQKENAQYHQMTLWDMEE